MLTLWSQTLIPTARQAPADAEVPSHQLMLRAGYIRKLGSGIYDYLPLGLRSLHRAMAIVREEMNRAGAIEVLLPLLQPLELWVQSGRRYAYPLFIAKDHNERELTLGPTHEEVITELMSGYIESYKNLPKTLYQIGPKFRDEPRPRFGVLRSREFLMKDAYSFHVKVDGPGGLNEAYQKQYDAYCRIFERCGLPYEIVEAESGPIGGSASHEFMAPSPTGEDTILKSDKGNYAANVEKCAIGERTSCLDDPPIGDINEVHTPSVRSIEGLCEFWQKELKSKLKPQSVLKTLVYKTDWRYADDRPIWLVAVVRGDHEVNEAKLRIAVQRDERQWFFGQGTGLRLADENEAARYDFAIGFVGPHVIAKRKDVRLVIDPDAARGGFWVVGANKVDHHARAFSWKRDIPWLELHDCAIVADIRNAAEGDPSPKNDGGVLRVTKGIEIGHVFKLGTKYSDSLGFNVLDENNQRVPVIMGCYGIGINRILAAAIERTGGHDENGIIWPAALAPYDVVITPIKWDGAQRDAACGLAKTLEDQGLDVLIDDRDERPGVKFKDADLIGIPVRITIGDKALAEGKVEIKARTAAQAKLVPLEAAVARVAELLKAASR